MAIITVGALISNIRGSIGGVTFSRNASGITAKIKLPGRKSKTGKQLTAIQTNNELVRQWNLLSLADQLLWAVLAGEFTKTDRYNNTKTLTGYNWFVSINYVYFYENGSYLTVPPALTFPDFLPTISAILSLDDIVLSFSLPIDTGVLGIFVFATTPVKTTAKYKRGSLRQLDVRGIDYSETFSIVDAWELATGLVWSELTEGAKFGLSFQVFAYSKTSGITGTSVTCIAEL